MPLSGISTKPLVPRQIWKDCNFQAFQRSFGSGIELGHIKLLTTVILEKLKKKRGVSNNIYTIILGRVP